MWHGYCLIEIDTELDDEQKVMVKQALMQLGRQSGPAHKVTQFRPSLDKQKAILELELSSIPTKAQVCNKLAELLPWTAGQISDNSTFTVSPGDTWEERRKATVQYLINNKEEWETDV